MSITTSTPTIQEVAARFHALAQQEKWFEIQDEFFSEDIQSIEPPTATHLQSASGKAAVRRKAEDWVKRITDFHRGATTAPVIGGDFFAVGREMEITVAGIGRLQSNQIMLYEVKDGLIIREQFFY
ncbi:nuclear transport factor 2 family protein [Chitinophaga sp. Mgbs1]|uniref:Nuclear transport factor 2 family protein n=1 Tax=Chitinophaga solisilvae TaxID=1233460 RepID=A0A433WFR2_9BACT|nr:nuclear transport factor 2 family protein [Chitinophaga solisilvae]